MLISEKTNQRGTIVLIRLMGCFRKVDRRWKSYLGGLMGHSLARGFVSRGESEDQGRKWSSEVKVIRQEAIARGNLVMERRRGTRTCCYFQCMCFPSVYQVKVYHFYHYHYHHHHHSPMQALNILIGGFEGAVEITTKQVPYCCGHKHHPVWNVLDCSFWGKQVPDRLYLLTNSNLNLRGSKNLADRSFLRKMGFQKELQEHPKLSTVNLVTRFGDSLTGLPSTSHL